MARIVVFVSGSGTNLQAILDAQGSELAGLGAVVGVVSNRAQAYGLTRAKNANIPTLYFPLKPYKDEGRAREEYDADLARKVALDFRPDLIVLAGWMHILSPAFLDNLGDVPVINLHPALPGEFNGANAIARAFEAYQRGELQARGNRTGAMVHRVTPVVDVGEVIASMEVPIKADDTLEALETRMHETEHTLLVAAVRKMLQAHAAARA